MALEAADVDFRSRWKASAGPRTRTRRQRLLSAGILLIIALVAVAVAAGIVLGPLFTWQTACITLVIDEYPLGVLEPVPFGQEDREALRTSLAGSLHTSLGTEPVDLTGFDSAQGVRDLLLPRMRGLSLRGKDVLLAYVRGQAFVAPPVFQSTGLERVTPLSGVPCLLASDCRIAGDRPQEIVPLRSVIDAVAASPARTTLVALDLGDLQWDPRLGVLGHVVPAALDRDFAKPQADAISQTWVIGSHDLFQMSSASVQARRTCFGRAFELAPAGEADKGPSGNGNGLIELDEVARFVSVWTNEWTRRLSGGRSRQTPVVWKLGVGRVAIEQIPPGIHLLRVASRRPASTVPEPAEKPSTEPVEEPAAGAPDAGPPPGAPAVMDAAVRQVAAVDEAGRATLAFPGDAAVKLLPAPGPLPPAAGNGDAPAAGGGNESAQAQAAEPAKAAAGDAAAAKDSAKPEGPEALANDPPPPDGAEAAADGKAPKTGAAGPGTPPATPEALPPPPPPRDAWEALATLGQRRLEPVGIGSPSAILPIPGDYVSPWWRQCYAIAASAKSRSTSTGPMAERAATTFSLMGNVLGRMASSPVGAAPPSGESAVAEQLWSARVAADASGYFQLWSAAPDAFCRVVAIRNESLATVVSAIDIVGHASGGSGTPPLDPAALVSLAAKLRELDGMLSAGADAAGIDRLTSAARGVNSQRAAIADQLERLVEGLHSGGGAGLSPVVSRSLAAVRSPLISEASRERILQQAFPSPSAVVRKTSLEATGRPTGVLAEPPQIQPTALESIAALAECLPAIVEAADAASKSDLLAKEIAAVRREIASLSNASDDSDTALDRVVRLGGRVASLLADVGAVAATASQAQGREGLLSDRDTGLFRVMDLRDIPQLEPAAITGLPDWSSENSYGLSLELVNAQSIAVGKSTNLRLAADSGGMLPAGTEVRFLFDPASLELRLADGSRVAADVPLPVESLAMERGAVLLTAVASRYAITPGERVLLEVIWESPQQATVARQLLPLPANRAIAVAARQTTAGSWQWGREQPAKASELQQGEVGLRMVPGGLAAWQLALLNKAEISRDVAVSLYAIGGESRQALGPTPGRDVLWQRLVEQFSRGQSLGTPLGVIEKAVLPAGETLVPLVFPADAAPPSEKAPPATAPPPAEPSATPPSIGPDLALVIREQTKGEPARQWLYRLRCEPLHPQTLLEVSAIWKEAGRTIEWTFALNDVWGEQLRVPAEGVSIAIEPLLPETGRSLQVRRGQTVLTGDRRSDTLVASWNGPLAGPPAMVAVNVNGYPRAFVFAVACEPGMDGQAQRPQRDWRMLRFVEPAQPLTVLKAPASAVPITLQVDAPPDAGAGSIGPRPTIASLGLREMQAGTFLKQPQRLLWVSESDRAIAYTLEKAEPPVSLAIRTTATDWQLELPGDGFVNVDVEAEAMLVLPGNQPPLTTARQFVFDGRPPTVNVPPSVNAVVGRPLVIPAEVVDDPREAFAGVIGRHLPGVSGVDTVEWALDLKGDGMPEAWQPAVSTGAAAYEIRLDTKPLPVGTRLPLLVRATDRCGLAAPPQRVWVLTAAEVAKGRIEGRVVLDGRGEANVPITVSGPGTVPAVKSGKDGVFVIPDLEAGDYELKANGVVRNVTYTSAAQKVKVELPPAPVSSVTIELE